MGQVRIYKMSRLTILVICLACLWSARCNENEGSDCFVKWVHGYRLASGRPQKILHSVSLEICKQECASTVGCAAFAFGTTRNSTTQTSSICELAINSKLRSKSTQTQQPPSSRNIFQSQPTRFTSYQRDGRSITTQPPDQNATSTTQTPTISIEDLDRNPTYDVYIENPNSNEPCFKRDALYEPSYPVNNHIGPVRDYHTGHFSQHQNGVPIDCFYRLMSGKRLVKTHTLRSISVNSLQECQEACIHDRSFNCRSISYRYMSSQGYSYSVSNCELSSYYMQSGTISSSYSKLDFVEDYDYDYFQRETHCKTTSSTTLGVCAVVVRRGGRVSTTLIKSSHHTVTSSQCEHLCATSLFRCRAFAFRHTTRGRDPYVSNRYPSSSPLTPTRDLPPPSDHTCLLYDTDLMRLPSYNIEPDPDFDLFEMGRLMGAECVLYEQFLNRRPGYYAPGPVTSTVVPYPAYPENRHDGYYPPTQSYPPHGNNHACLRLFRQDAYLVPEVSRATFPVKTLEECRIECIRSLEVLRFPCRAMAYRHTSHSSLDRGHGGTCQLTDNEPRDPDLVQSRDRYEGGVTYIFDSREPGCSNGAVGGSYYDRGAYSYDRYGDTRGRDRYGGDYYNRDRYYAYDRDRQGASSYPSNRYYERDYNRQGGGYNQHYWDYHNRHHGTGGRYGDHQYADSRYPGQYGHVGQYGQATTSYYDSDYRNGQGGTTVNGERCLRGCRLNRDAGFYYCQTDESGAWDFCCRPDHFCGYSKGLSVPWCYVGTGPSQNIWRSCEAKGSRNNPFFGNTQRVEYLHAALPPTVHSLSNTEVANLTKDNAIRLFTSNSTIEDVGSGERKFVAKQSGGSQEVIVRVSNSTAVSNSSLEKKDGKGKS